MPFITFEPMHVRLECQDGESILEVARRHGVPVDTACVGRATCGLCRVKVTGGEEHLVPFNERERKHLGNVYYLTKQRLACQARVVPLPAGATDPAEIAVEVPPIRRRLAGPG